MKRLKTGGAIIAGLIAYIITVIINIITYKPLGFTLSRALIAFFLIAIISWLVLFLLETFSKWSDDEIKKEDNKKHENKDDDLNDEQEVDFSPLNPSVLEVEDEESE